ncbi:MAG: trigger factor [Rhodospirillales bacterium]|nr:trigger factor [Rhodospirillales bacterium]MDH3911077.1 trigger factor [Rhodospirillales bacterium]MDH3920585.1 trigger factor [Rhodospirillales bacterium]MDH3966592.1 trigger factor [Rhodospirillales bacterium]
MQVTETQTDGLKHEYKVVIAASDIAEKMAHRLQEIGQQVRLPGFRPGKVPVNILKQRFGSSVMGEVLERAVTDSSNQALTERGLRPALQPKIEIVSFDEGKDLEYTMALEVLPDIKVMDFAQIELEGLTVEVPDQEVQGVLERLAGSHKKTQALSKKRKARSDDVLVIDFRGSVDGEELPGMAAEGHHLELGSNRFVAGFEEQLIGIDVGEEREITVTFPEAYANDKLAGKDAVFQVKVHDILETVPMEINDDLAVALGEENLESLKGKVRQQVELDYGQLARARLKRALLDQLADGHQFPVPAGMVDEEFDVIWKQLKEDHEQGRIDPEDKDKDDEVLRAEYRAIAERRVRLGLLLSEVGRQNGIDVTQDEANRALMQEAQRHQGHEREVFDFYQKSPEAMAKLRAPIFEDKVIDFITALAKVTERKVTPQELQNEDSASEPATASKKKTAAKSAAKKTKTTKGKTAATKAGKES